MTKTQTAAITAETARIQAENAERLAYLIGLAHEGITEIVARDGAPCCSTPDATAWWVVELGEGYGPGVKCQRCAAELDRHAELDRRLGHDTYSAQIMITRIPTLAQAADAVAAEAAGIGTN